MANKKIYYEKVGRKYVPVAEYDSDMSDAFRKGTHIVMSYPGGQSRRYDIDPAFGPMIAAGRVAEDAISNAISVASALRPVKTPITPEQAAAWENLKVAFGESLSTLHGVSFRDIAEAGVRAMQDEADKLMKHESVKHAYEQFLLVAALVKEHE